MLSKNACLSEELRKNGNDEFNKRRFDIALVKYNQCVLCSPGSSEQLALAYGNRSAVFFERNQLQECLRDVERALAIAALSEASKEKLQIRRLKCLSEINKETYPQIEKRKMRNPVPVVAEPCSSMPSMSNSCEMKYNKTEGRHLIARRNIEAGEVLIVENPYVFVPLPECGERFCHNCCEKMPLDFVPCDSCVDVKFCSEACRNEANDVYHVYECGELRRLFPSSAVHLALRMFTCSGTATVFSYFCRCEKEGEGKEGKFGLSADDDFTHSYEVVYNLVTNSKKMNPEDVARYKMACGMLCERLIDKGFMDGIKSAVQNDERICDRCKDSTNIGNHLLTIFVRHVEQALCNTHGINCVDRNESSGAQATSTFKRKLGTAIFPTASLMNHSCDANTFLSFCGKTVVVRATRDIKAGEQIYDCYGPQVGRKSTEERRRVLSEQYFFDCCCRCCTSDDERKKEALLLAFACAKCGDALVRKSSESQFYCNRCSVNYPKVVELTEELKNRFLVALREQNFVNVEKELKNLEKVLYVHNKRLMELRDKAAELFALPGEITLTTHTMVRNLDTYAFIYGECTMEVGDEVFYLVSMMGTLKKRKVAYASLKNLLAVWIEKAVKIFTVHYGSDCWQLEEIKEAMKEED